MSRTSVAAPPAVRLTAKGQATHDRIVSAAAALMFERGVGGTTTEDVQRAAGVSASQVYHYFKDKKALVRAVIAFQNEAVVGPQEPFLSQLDSFESLTGWRDAIVALQRKRHFEGGCPIGSLGSELSEDDPVARADVAAGFARWEVAIRQGLQGMYDRGELRTDADPEQLALGLLVALQGGLLLTQIRRDTVALEAGLDTMLAHIATYLAPKKPAKQAARGRRASH